MRIADLKMSYYGMAQRRMAGFARLAVPPQLERHSIQKAAQCHIAKKSQALFSICWHTCWHSID